MSSVVGWAAVPWIRHAPPAVSWEETLVLVDRALYLAKRNGRNRIECAHREAA